MLPTLTLLPYNSALIHSKTLYSSLGSSHYANNLLNKCNKNNNIDEMIHLVGQVLHIKSTSVL